jgi:hypothetical protein
MEVEGTSNDHGLWQTFTIDTYVGRTLTSGDAVFLIAHTGNLVDVESELAQARWNDRGGWQRFVIQKYGGGTIYPGDTVFLEAYTGNLIDIEGTEVKARWTERGDWQALVIEKLTSRRLHKLTSVSSKSPSRFANQEAIEGAALGGLIGILLTSCFLFMAVRVCADRFANDTEQQELTDCESPSVRKSGEQLVGFVQTPATFPDIWSSNGPRMA